MILSKPNSNEYPKDQKNLNKCLGTKSDRDMRVFPVFDGSSCSSLPLAPIPDLVPSLDGGVQTGFGQVGNLG